VRISSIRAVATSAALVLIAGSSIASAGELPGLSRTAVEAVVTRAVPTSAVPSSAPSIGPMLRAAPMPSPTPTPTPARAPTASATPAAVPTIALVPVVGFWSAERSTSRDRLAAIIAGRDRTFRRVVVAAPDLAALAADLAVRPGAGVAAASAEEVLDAVRGTADTIGFVRAGDVRPSVRALDVDGRSLFGNGRVRSIHEWPLATSVAATTLGQGSPLFDPATTWTLVAAGDVMNDWEVYRRTILLGAGPDFPWDGGTARIVTRTCCNAGETTVTAKRTGNAGAVRALFRDADVSVVNHEGPAPDRPVYHPHGLVFSFDPRLETGLRDAGVDIVSLANNHIRNAGSDGVVQTIRNVKAAGMTPVGAGKDAETARRPVVKTINGVRVAFLAYDAISLPDAGATATRPGAAPLDLEQARRDIRAARTAGAQVVVVVPHWGVEYTDRPTTTQREQAAALVAAGADVILGSHPHWIGAVEEIDDGVVLYSLGDFIFDLTRSEETEEGLIAELTFAGARLMQIDLHPTIQLDRSQPNLLEPRDSRVILDRIRKASDDRLGW
jgi:poly-gamma-glutamate synthesis protein (capsule biosynthesis protein)